MRYLAPALALPALALLAACNSNTAPGNDQEAQLEPAPTAAPVASAGDALSDIAVGGVQPEIMNDADIASLGGMQGKCVIRMTEVAFPSMLYDREGGGGAVKINGKLVVMPQTGEGTFEQDGLRVTLRPAEEEIGDDGMREAEMIMMLPGAEDELGFSGFEECPDARAS